MWGIPTIANKERRVHWGGKTGSFSFRKGREKSDLYSEI